MDKRQFLVFVFSANLQEWEDQTQKIVALEDTGSRIAITYGNGKTYQYGKKRVRYYQDPKSLNISRSLVEVDGKALFGWQELLDFGEHYTFINESQSHTLDKGEIKIIPSIIGDPSVDSLLDYYRYLAGIIKDKFGFLNKYYQENLAFIRQDSIANHFAFQLPPKVYSAHSRVIYPFGINASQKRAVGHALTSQISLIQGPPGTGKTQTILNIISNLLLENKTVAVVAGNNSATDNVFEKLDALGMGFLCARLGSNKNKEAFFGSEQSLPDLSQWALTNEQQRVLEGKIHHATEQLDTLLYDKNRLAKIRQQLARLKTEKHFFDHSFDVEQLDPSQWTIAYKWALPDFLSFLAEVDYYSEKGELKWPTKLRWFFKYRMIKFGALATMNESVFRGLAGKYYEHKLLSLEADIDELEEKLKAQSYDNYIDTLTRASKRLFQGALHHRYSTLATRRFNHKDVKNDFAEFTRRFPILLSTTSSIINNKGENDLFDYVIVDEASQVDLLTGFLAFASAKNIVAVGDLKQLPHIPNEELSKVCVSVEQKLGIHPFHSYKTQSLLSALSAIYQSDPQKVSAPSTLLQEHYRCHPRIIEFCSQKFYKGQLIVMTDADSDPFKGVKTVRGNHARRPQQGGGYFNMRELEVIEEEILNMDLVNEDDATIGIVSPYRAQTDEAAQYFEGSEIAVDTVYKFQGREKDTIIFTTASNMSNKFVDNPNLLNVAVSRAKNKFCLVTSDSNYRALGTNIGDLLRHIEYQSREPALFESNILSIFDCLYRDFSSALAPFRAKVKKRTGVLSEDLMWTLLEEEMDEERFNVLGLVAHYSLSLLFKVLPDVTERERQFIGHNNSHVDFLIFNKFNMAPLLAIEVDGYKYHCLDPKQQERDQVKNAIFAQAGIPLLRFSTIGSRERPKIRQALNELFNEVPDSDTEQIKGNF